VNFWNSKTVMSTLLQVLQRILLVGACKKERIQLDFSVRKERRIQLFSFFLYAPAMSSATCSIYLQMRSVSCICTHLSIVYVTYTICQWSMIRCRLLGGVKEIYSRNKVGLHHGYSGETRKRNTCEYMIFDLYNIWF